MSTNEPRFTCRLERWDAFSAHSITPPDSEFLSAVVKGLDLRDVSIEGLDTHELRIRATGADAAARLEFAFRKHFRWGFVYGGEATS